MALIALLNTRYAALRSFAALAAAVYANLTFSLA